MRGEKRTLPMIAGSLLFLEVGVVVVWVLIDEWERSERKQKWWQESVKVLLGPSG